MVCREKQNRTYQRFWANRKGGTIGVGPGRRDHPAWIFAKKKGREKGGLPSDGCIRKKKSGGGKEGGNPRFIVDFNQKPRRSRIRAGENMFPDGRGQDPLPFRKE